MATWDITYPAATGIGGSGSGSASITPPGDFDGATIDDVSLFGSPAVISEGTTDDTIGVRWRIQTTAAAAVWGDYASDGISLMSASLGDGVTGDFIVDGSAPSPAPSIAVAADWDEVAYNANYAANMKNDAETVSWSTLTIRITYTPTGGPVTNRTLTDTLAVTDPADLELRERNRVLSDNHAIIDTAVMLRERIRRSLDLLDVTDAQDHYSVSPRVLLSNLAVIDNAVMLRERARVLLDTISIVDNIIAISTGVTNKILIDSFAVTDLLIPLRLLTREITNNLAVTDNTAIIRERLRITADALAVTDFKIVLSERIRVLINNLLVTDTTIELRERYRLLSEAFIVVDNAIATYIPADGGGAINNRTLSDVLSIVDFNIELRERIRLYQDTVDVIDSVLMKRDRDRLLLDTVTGIADSLSFFRVRLQTDLDEISVTDSNVTLLERKRILQSVISATDNLLTLRQRYRKITDDTTVIDEIIALYITEVLNPIITSGLETLDIDHGVELLNIDHGVELLNIDLGIERETG